MARVKKDENSKNTDAVAGGKVEKKPKAKPKPHSNNPPVAEMVQNALDSLKSRQGCSLIAIRKYITENYDGEMTKQRQNLIKKFMSEEFEAGRIKMTNDDETTINFKKRFNVVAHPKKED